ncbi:MAG: sulfatase [Acidobacteriota bacterium]
MHREPCRSQFVLRSGMTFLIGLLVWLTTGLQEALSGGKPVGSPNIVIVFADDMGYADVGLYGAKGFKTPHLDRMAREGVRFTSFYVGQPVCSASRAALLTGCYSNRIGIHGALGPKDQHGIHDDEVTLAELLKSRGYATAIFGKWHLGHHSQFLPLRHGFDEYFGLPYSNDMWPNHPTHGGEFPPLPLIHGNQVVQTMPDQSQLTTWYTQKAVQFIEKNQSRPFFLYVPHSMPHVPLFVSQKYQGKTKRGLYGDVISQIDWSVGEILGALKRNGLDQNTLVIFTSDNGPWLSYGNHSGSAKPLREGKGTVWEGGIRVPCIVRWPGQIPAGRQVAEPAMTIDILPTLARLVGAEPPKHRIDGKDIWPLMSAKPGARSPQEVYFFYYQRSELQALRSGRWKLILPHTYRTLAGRRGGRDGMPVPYEQRRVGLELYDLEKDVGETKNVADKYPDVVKRLEALAEQARQDLGDSLTNRTGKNLREAGRLPDAESNLQPNG